MADEKSYDWAKAMLSLAVTESQDLNDLAAAAQLDPAAGDLSSVDLSDIDLSGQNLSGWDLSNANFNRANIKQTNLQNALIDPWEVVNAENWEEAILDAKVRELLNKFNRNLLRRIYDLELELSARSYNSLRLAGVKLIGDLVKMTEAELLRIPNFGRKSLNETKELLAQMGLHFGMNVPDWRSQSYHAQSS
jgi:uncharacterized protein YjbI with pentapeptide repeats